MKDSNNDPARTTVAESGPLWRQEGHGWSGTGLNAFENAMESEYESSFDGERVAFDIRRAAVRDIHEMPGICEVYDIIGFDIFDAKLHHCAVEVSSRPLEHAVVKIFDAEFHVAEDVIAIQKDLEHPNLIKLYDVLQANVFVLEYCVGGTLQDWLYLQDNRDVLARMDVPTGACFVKGILSAIVYLHSLTIFHGDIRPGNCFMAERNSFGSSSLKLGDLVTRRAYSANLMKYYEQVARYMAPEVLECGLSSTSADVFSCGMLVYEVMSGQLPFEHLYTSQEIEEAICAEELPALDMFAELEGGDIPADLLRRCWAGTGDRVPATYVLEQLENLSR